MAVFRRCLKQEIDSRLEILHGYPPESCLRYKAMLMQVFAKQGTAVATRRCLLSLCPNGEWRSSRVEFYIAPGKEPAFRDRKSVLDHVVSGLTVALAACQPALYNRSRWTGSDRAVDDLAIIEAVHKLLSTTFARFAASYLTGARARQTLAHGQRLADYELVRLVAVEGEAVADDAAPGDAAQASGGGGAANDDEENEEKATFAEQNSKDRSAAWKFMCNQPLGWMVLTRLLMEPLRHHLARQFLIASDAWDRKQQAIAARAAMSGIPVARAFRVTEVASGRMQAAFFKRVYSLLRAPELWEAMPPAFHTVEMRAIAFAACSRMGCAFHRSQTRTALGWPMKLFRLIHEPGLAAELKDTPRCVMDLWSRKLAERYPSFEHPELLAILEVAARKMPVDISQVESLHASCRRLLKSKSLQTHQMSVSGLSSQWVCQRHRCDGKRRRRREVAESKKPKKAAITRKTRRKTSGAPSRTGSKKVKKPGFGGAWRAWMQLFGRRRPTGGSVKDVSAEYRAAKAANTPEYQKAFRVGKAGTSSRKQGGRGLGRKRVFEAVGRRAWLKQCHRALADIPSDQVGEVALAIARHAAANGATIAETLSIGRARAAEVTRREKLLADHELQTIEQYASTIGATAVQQFKEEFPQYRHELIVAEPAPFGPLLTVQAPNADEAVHAWSHAAEHSNATGLAVRLDKQWDFMHRPIVNADCQSVGNATEHSICCRAGMCLCSDTGARIRARADKFLRYLAQICPPKTPNRSYLAASRLVLRFTGRPKSYEEMLADDAEEVELWVHIGHMQFSPYSPEVLIVEPADDPMEVAPSPQRVYVRSLRFTSYYDAMIGLGKCGKIDVQVYLVEHSKRPLARFLPEPVPLLLHHDFESAVVWWPRLKAAGSRGRDRGDGDGADADLAAADDLPVDDEEDVIPDEGPAADEELDLGVEIALDELNMDLPDPTLERRAEPPPAPESAAELLPAAEAVVDPTHSPAEAAPPVKKQRQRAAVSGEVMVVVPGGFLTWYSSNNNFQATCVPHFAERCTLTKKGKGAAAGSRAAAPAGRPLGYMMAWLQQGCGCITKGSHKEKGQLEMLAGADDHDIRLESRCILAGIPGSELLFEQERDPTDGEDEEPTYIS